MSDDDDNCCKQTRFRYKQIHEENDNDTARRRWQQCNDENNTETKGYTEFNICAQTRTQYDQDEHRCVDRVRWKNWRDMDDDINTNNNWSNYNTCEHTMQYEQNLDDECLDRRIKWTQCMTVNNNENTCKDNDFDENNICAQTRMQYENKDEYQSGETRLKWKDCTVTDVYGESGSGKYYAESNIQVEADSNLIQDNIIDVCSETRKKCEEYSKFNICEETRRKYEEDKKTDICSETRLKREKSNDDVCTRTRLKQKFVDMCKKTKKQESSIENNEKKRLRNARISTVKVKLQDADVCTENKQKIVVCADPQPQPCPMTDVIIVDPKQMNESCMKKSVADMLTEKIMKRDDEILVEPQMKLMNETCCVDKRKIETVNPEPEPPKAKVEEKPEKEVDICADTRMIREKVVRREFFECWKAVAVIFGVFCVIGIIGACFSLLYPKSPSPVSFSDQPHF